MNPLILKNKNLEIHLDLPTDNYQFSRFDWTGKLIAVHYQGRLVSGQELASPTANTRSGQGFYNEFGITSPLGFEETRLGSWFHKIGVGLLRKEDDHYDFNKAYDLRPAAFTTFRAEESIRLQCRSAAFNGYAYLLEKKIQLLESGFRIDYRLENTGEKTIATNEYNHNFLAFDHAAIGSDYVLRFPFQIRPERFGETVNPEQRVVIGSQEVSFNGTPQQPFFFSNLTGGATVAAHWELLNTKQRIGVTETGSFKTKAVNVWGMGHVISPELFIDLLVAAGQATTWSRTYRFFELTTI